MATLVTTRTFEQLRSLLTAGSLLSNEDTRRDKEAITALVLESIEACSDHIDLLSLFHDFNREDIFMERVVPAFRERMQKLVDGISQANAAKFLQDLEDRLRILTRD